MNINVLDIAVAAVLLIFAWLGGYKGFVRSVFGLFRMLAALLLTRMLYPAVSKFVRENTGLYELIKKWVIDALKLQSATGMETAASKIDIINALPLPKNLLTTLLANNNPEAYGVLKAVDIQGYIGGYIANSIINILCMIITFAVISVILSVLVDLLDLLARLPVINTLNRFGGVAIGLIKGGFIVWLILLLMTLFLARASYAELYALLESSHLAILFYDTNLLMDMILQIFV